jgi:hypothetical protein
LLAAAIYAGLTAAKPTAAERRLLGGCDRGRRIGHGQQEKREGEF